MTGREFMEMFWEAEDIYHSRTACRCPFCAVYECESCPIWEIFYVNDGFVGYCQDHIVLARRGPGRWPFKNQIHQQAFEYARAMDKEDK